MKADRLPKKKIPISEVRKELDRVNLLIAWGGVTHALIRRRSTLRNILHLWDKAQKKANELR